MPPPLVCRGIEYVGIAWVEVHLIHAGVFVDMEYPLPGLSSIRGVVESAVAARSPEGTLCSHPDDIRILWMNDDSRDVLTFLQAHVGPTRAGIVADMTEA